jgi:hypothetical protein
MMLHGHELDDKFHLFCSQISHLNDQSCLRNGPQKKTSHYQGESTNQVEDQEK